MKTVKDILHFTETFAPLSLAEEWDNVGVLVGEKDRTLKRALLCLDITKSTIEEARESGCELMISHHPVIFRPLSTLKSDSPQYLLAKYDIAALCLHTNLDRADHACGVNRALANALSLKNQAFFPEDFLLTGELDRKMNAEEFALYLKERLGAPDIRYTDSGNAITRVAVSSGGGGEGIERFGSHGFDAFVTGELKHHQFLFSKTNRISAFEAGHYPTENLAMPLLKETLASAFVEIEFILSESPCPYLAK